MTQMPILKQEFDEVISQLERTDFQLEKFRREAVRMQDEIRDCLRQIRQLRIKAYGEER